MMTPRDGSGRFVPTELAATWLDTCAMCDEPKARHKGLRVMTMEPWCPGADLTSFEPCSPSDCDKPTVHAVGCDCRWGRC
jgi:hypothetical protein